MQTGCVKVLGLSMIQTHNSLKLHKWILNILGMQVAKIDLKLRRRGDVLEIIKRS